MAASFTSSKFSATDASGNPLAGGLVYSYSAGTLTPKATYTTQAGNVANANPVVLDSTGRADIWLGSGTYKFVVTDSAGAPAPDGTVDNVSAVADLASTASGEGASLIGIQDSGNYFSGANVESALQQLAPGVFQSPWYITKDSPVLLSLRHTTSGNIIQQWQDGGTGTATYFYKGLSVQTDSHSMQMGPATNGGSCDLLWQRSTLNADPAGNRFNITFNESTDRLDLSFATTASGSPSFDSWAQIVAGTSPTLTFPAIAAQFNLGVGVKQRAAGGFECRFIPTSSTVADIKQIGGSGTTFISFRDAAMGFFGSTGTSRPTVTGSRASGAALASLLSALDTLGLITNSSSA